jgi:predicted acetyltransferase
VSLEIRVPTEEEIDRWFSVIGASFSDELKEEDKEHDKRMLPPDRRLVAYEGGAMIGTAADVPLTLTIPGGELPASGLTMVGVLPSHRRRGALTGLMRRHLDAARERGEALSILWASEPPIYGRYGYGVATMRAWIEADRDRVAFRGSPEPAGHVRMVDASEAEQVLPRLYERVRKETPGMFVRTPEWWREYKFPDPEHRRRGGGPRFIALLELDGQPEAYAMYRVHEKWPEGFPASLLRVQETVATSPLASREIWRFLFGVDLVARVEAEWLPVDHALLLLVTDPRRLRPRLSDGLWLRILDLERALGARSYAAEGSVGLELHDSFVGDNGGVWTLEAGPGGAEVRRGGEAELRLDIGDLASAYLGGHSFGRLAAAGLVDELAEGAVDRADALFRTRNAPWCPEVF